MWGGTKKGKNIGNKKRKINYLGERPTKYLKYILQSIVNWFKADDSQKVFENLTATHTHIFTTMLCPLQVETEAWKKTIKKSCKEQGKREDSRSTQSLTLSHLQGSFYILGLAWALSGLVFSLEILIHQYRRYFAALT